MAGCPAQIHVSRPESRSRPGDQGRDERVSGNCSPTAVSIAGTSAAGRVAARRRLRYAATANAARPRPASPWPIASKTPRSGPLVHGVVERVAAVVVGRLDTPRGPDRPSRTQAAVPAPRRARMQGHRPGGGGAIWIVSPYRARLVTNEHRYEMRKAFDHGPTVSHRRRGASVNVKRERADPLGAVEQREPEPFIHRRVLDRRSQEIDVVLNARPATVPAHRPSAPCPGAPSGHQGACS